MAQEFGLNHKTFRVRLFNCVADLPATLAAMGNVHGCYPIYYFRFQLDFKFSVTVMYIWALEHEGFTQEKARQMVKLAFNRAKDRDRVRDQRRRTITNQKSLVMIPNFIVVFNSELHSL